MGIYDDITKTDSLDKGDHLMKIESVDMKVAKSSNNEYIQLKMKTKAGETFWHNIHFSDGALPMAVRQLKTLMLTDSLPQYGSVELLKADRPNFIRKAMELLMMLEKKKLTMNCSGHDENGRPKLFIKAYSDAINAAIQKETAATTSKLKDTFNKEEELPF